jgi:Transmembrane secretion effector
MAFYTVAFQGATGTGALALGAIAQVTSLRDGLFVLTAALVVGSAATFRLKLPKPGEIDVTPADAMPLPVVPEGTVGTVLVTAAYGVAPGSEDEFLAHADRLKHFRQRTGGMYWRLFVDEATPGRYLETFLVGSWEEHERQHMRGTQHDQALLAEIDKLLVPGTKRDVHHYLSTPADR